MAYDKTSKPDSQMRRRPGRRRKKVCTFPKEERFFREESQETVQSIREP